MTEQTDQRGQVRERLVDALEAKRDGQQELKAAKEKTNKAQTEIDQCLLDIPKLNTPNMEAALDHLEKHLKLRMEGKCEIELAKQRIERADQHIDRALDELTVL